MAARLRLFLAAIWPTGPGSGLGLELFEGGRKQVMLLPPDPELKRPSIESGDDDSHDRKRKAAHPIKHELQTLQRPLQHGDPANEHRQRSQQDNGAEPSATGSSVESHGGKVAWLGREGGEQTE